MEQLDISHREIYDRLVAVESKVDALGKNTKDVVDAFNAAAGAFKVLELLAKIAKPVLWLAAALGSLSVIWSNWKGH